MPDPAPIRGAVDRDRGQPTQQDLGPMLKPGRVGVHQRHHQIVRRCRHRGDLGHDRIQRSIPRESRFAGPRGGEAAGECPSKLPDECAHLRGVLEVANPVVEVVHGADHDEVPSRHPSRPNPLHKTLDGTPPCVVRAPPPGPVAASATVPGAGCEVPGTLPIRWKHNENRPRDPQQPPAAVSEVPAENNLGNCRDGKGGGNDAGNPLRHGVVMVHQPRPIEFTNANAVRRHRDQRAGRRSWLAAATSPARGGGFG